MYQVRNGDYLTKIGDKSHVKGKTSRKSQSSTDLNPCLCLWSDFCYATSSCESESMYFFPFDSVLLEWLGNDVCEFEFELFVMLCFESEREK